ncbi:UNC93-like protein [Araneus ventricosus]|uniref:UNC93-like protein n=1 Tax=Araneus ventricosus TaxID=182803 RepID=A0A4Y2M0M2_ARAVE|nr:UNC93-like protein [Araneus ventricosus]
MVPTRRRPSAQGIKCPKVHSGHIPATSLRSYVACAWGTYHVGLVAVCYGVACGASSLLSGWCVRHCGRRPVFTVAAVVNVVSVVFLLLWIPDSKFPKMFFFASALWGIHVGIVWSQLRAFYGVLFPSDEEAAFSAFHLWSGLGFCVAFGFSNFFCISHKLYVILAVSVLGFSGYYTVELIYFKNNKDSY